MVRDGMDECGGNMDCAAAARLDCKPTGPVSSLFLAAFERYELPTTHGVAYFKASLGSEQ